MTPTRRTLLGGVCPMALEGENESAQGEDDQSDEPWMCHSQAESIQGSADPDPRGHDQSFAVLVALLGGGCALHGPAALRRFAPPVYGLCHGYLSHACPDEGH